MFRYEASLVDVYACHVPWGKAPLLPQLADVISPFLPGVLKCTYGLALHHEEANMTAA